MRNLMVGAISSHAALCRVILRITRRSLQVSQFRPPIGGLKWTRTIDLSVISRVL